MLDGENSVKVHTSLRSDQNNKMLRGMYKLGGHGAFLEPYVTSLQVAANYSSAKSNQNSVNLPRLPVPKLKDTLDKYLLTVKPFLDDVEFLKTKSIVKDFETGLGQKLQALLEKRAETRDNWLEEWWLNTAYLEYRNPLVLYSSPGLLFPYKKFVNPDDQLRYASKTLLAAMQYKRLIDNNELPLEKMGKNPLDMQQYKKVFGTCRIPLEKRDKLSYNSDTRHVSVIHNNHIFHVDLWGQDGEMLSEEQIIQQLKKVVELSKIPQEEGIGILTSEYRDNWAKAYKLLSEDNTNKANLLDIQKSVVVLCLDAACGASKISHDDALRTLGGLQTLHGGGSKSNGANRWFDKTIQFIVGADGLMGLSYEHSPAEGQPIAVLTDYIIDYINQNKGSQTSSSSPIPPKLLNFNVSLEVSDMINAAKNNLDNLVAEIDLSCFQFKSYGKTFIKSQKLSPDSYLQMAMQLAFYRLYKTPGAHYESAATRMYVGGRTETIRSCSVESIEFAKTMLNNKSSPKEKSEALKRAVNGHKNYTVQALQGYGVDRHLLGLKLASIEYGIELHDLYSDDAYIRSGHMRISTSQVALKSDGLMCYAPLVADGYATCYNPRSNDMNFAASAFAPYPDTSSKKYRIALEESLHDMHNVLLQSTPSKL